ncbi:GNAT family N-acetyltransferase [Candidatus Poribacteria bacterium]|nr:GNAT family N-acetyltransferase [Candidatus Poribacteria bacterium]MYG07064.1 GNAT family N-acetyltransferase [Candidatus Poribacteria bacterium]MYK22674.1 GNAT family N-acetyltransferase [Candidatus Poribacteria bacterium]
MEIRGARESELEQVVELSCVAFNPDGHQRYWQYVQGDSSYRPSQTRVVVVNDKVVSTLRVWERRIRVGESLVTMGGIGGVCTHPNYRSVGYASALMRDTIGYLQTIGCDLGVLFTIIPEAFYRQLGWTSLLLPGFSVAYNSSTSAAASSEWQGTDFNLETDLDAVAGLYDIANAQQSGTIARTRAYWDMAPCRIRGVLPTVIARRNGHISGYLNYEMDEKIVEVREVGCVPNEPEVLNALVSYLLKACAAQEIEKIEVKFPSQHPFAERLIAACNSPVTPTERSKMMLYAVNLPVLLRRLVVGWESQIAISDQAFPSLAVKLPVPSNQQIVIRHNADGTLQIVPEDADAVDLGVDLSDADFWQLLFGGIGWEQVRPDASVSPEIWAFLETLFPKRDVIFWVPDQY